MISQGSGSVQYTFGYRPSLVLLDGISWMGGYDPDFPGYLKTDWDTMFNRHDKFVLVLYRATVPTPEKPYQPK